MRLSATRGIFASVSFVVAALEPASAGAGASPRTQSLVDPPATHGRQVRPAPQEIPAPAPAPEPASDDSELQLIPQGRRPMPPPFPTDLDWVRTVPLNMEMFKGRVVLIEVWESTCVNCLRTLPVLSRLQARYRDHGFMVIAIHSPEFSFTATRAAVESAARRFGLEFPVASDSRRTFWKTWDVRGWPTTYLLDAHGLLANMHQGEPPRGSLEKLIRALLRERSPQIQFPPSEAIPANQDPYAPECGFVTPDIATEPGLDFLVNPEGLRRAGTIIYADPGSARSEGTFYLKGPWIWLRNGLQRGTGPESASLGITYAAKEVYAILANAGGIPQVVEIRQDGRSLTEANRGIDVEIAKDGRSYVRLVEPRLHYLVSDAAVGRHDLELFPSSPSFQIFNFTFGNRCQTDFPHR